MNGRPAFAAKAGVMRDIALTLWTFHDLSFLLRHPQEDINESENSQYMLC